MRKQRANEAQRQRRLTAVVADVAQRSAGLQQDLLVAGAEELDEWRDEAGFHAGGPHELWRRERGRSTQGHTTLIVSVNLTLTWLLASELTL